MKISHHVNAQNLIKYDVHVGPPGPLWAPLGPCGTGPCGPGPCGPPWTLARQAIVGRALVGLPGPLWASLGS